MAKTALAMEDDDPSGVQGLLRRVQEETDRLTRENTELREKVQTLESDLRAKDQFINRLKIQSDTTIISKINSTIKALEAMRDNLKS